MTLNEAAALMNGRQYLKELTADEEARLKASGIVAVFGQSDDLVELRGAINEEVDAWEGTTLYFSENGLLQRECYNDECPHFEEQKKAAKTIEAIWGEDGFSWVFVTEIPHERFIILEDDNNYCRGIVFKLESLKNQKTREKIAIEAEYQAVKALEMASESFKNKDLTVEDLIRLNLDVLSSLSLVIALSIFERDGSLRQPPFSTSHETHTPSAPQN